MVELRSKETTTTIDITNEPEPTTKSTCPDLCHTQFQRECHEAFGQTCLYKILGLEKQTATATEIKKAYYKLSLRYHPDKVTDALLKDGGKANFQLLGKIYSILSDEEKKKIYDDTGIIDGEDSEMFRGDQKDWEMYFRDMFKKVTKDDFNKFFVTYKKSAEERKDLLDIYEKNEGDMEKIMLEMISDDCVTEEPRFKEMINEAIEKGEAKEFDMFCNESKKKAAQRKAHYTREAEEAEEMRKEMGIDESQDSLRDTILARRKVATSSFLDNLEAKYSKKAAAKGGKKKDTESEGTEDDDDDFEDSDDEPSAKTLKRKSSLVKKTGTMNVTPKAAKRKVKRL